MDVLKELEEFYAYEAGWAFGEGDKISHDVIRFIADIVQEIIKIDTNEQLEFEFDPLYNGGVGLSASVLDDFMDIIINPDMTMFITHEKGVSYKYDILLDYTQIANKEEYIKYIKDFLNRIK